MDYFEAEGKRLLKQFGIATDEGFIVRGEDDYARAKYPCVAKAQVQSGHRGQAGGIRIVKNEQELRDAVAFISALTIGGKKVEGVLVVPAMKILKEHYLGYTIDSLNRRIMLLYSASGGMDIEDVAANCPDKLVRMDVTKQVDRQKLKHAVERCGVDEATAADIAEIAVKLYGMFCQLDATTIELNPLAELEGGELVAADCKLVIDDNALPRQGDYTLLSRPEQRNRQTLDAAEIGISYVEIDDKGNIGIIAGGAGIGMATVDTVKKYGLSPLNFMDLGVSTAEKAFKATKFLIELPQVESVLINVFGGFNNCAILAEGIVRAAQECEKKVPIVVKSRGNGQEEGWRILEEAGIPVIKYGTTDEAVLILKNGEVPA